MDPGHGEDTPGKRANGLLEYEFNFDVANKLKKLLEPYGNVVMTMEVPKHPHSEMTAKGRNANLQYRCDVANRVKGNSIFVSIHANAHSDPFASGYEIFVSHKSDKRYEIAKCVMSAAEDILGVGTEIKNRGIKEEGFYVLKNTIMPAILIEHEFYTNLEAVKKLKDDSFRRLCAEHIKEGLLKYLRGGN